MKSTIAPVLPIQDAAVFVATPVVAPDTAAARQEAPRQNADLRLIIEEDQASGTFIYKTLDRRTGEIVKQFPREQVIRLKDTASYAPGDVIDAQS